MTDETRVGVTVIDLETSVKCPIGTNKGNPHWPENKIVMAGFKHKRIPRIVCQDRKSFTTACEMADTFSRTVFAGVNIPFDLQHMYKEIKTVYDKRGQIRVWDCQIAEYLLTRQQHKYPSLDEMSSKYGGTLKDDEVKKHWENGGETEDIPKAKLEEYLKNDIVNTGIVFRAQLAEAVERDMMPLIMAQMEAAMAITEMQYNGICVNTAEVGAGLVSLVKDIRLAKDALNSIALSTDVPEHLINLDSPKSLSLIMFGGTVKEKVKVLDGMYKNGNPKFRTDLVDKQYKGLGYPTTGVSPTIHGWSTNDNTLKSLPASTFTSALQTLRELRKNYSTYYEPLTQIVFPDGCVHQNLNMTATQTGRLSCTEPNLQNITDKHKSDIKKVYISRFGGAGAVVEVDYKQLEIVALAELSRDEQLIKDCNDGIDIHTELFRNMFGRVPTDWERKQFKRLSFALIYGSGVKNMAQQAVVSEDVARNFKKTFEKRYPGVVAYRDKVRSALEKNRVANAFHDTDTGKPIGTSHYRLPTGRELYYREYVQAYGTKDVDFSYTEICNYPVQAFATGDIVPIMLGRLFRKIQTLPYKDKVLLVNTVHDSIMLDIHKDVIAEVLPIIRETLEEVPQAMEQLFGIKMVVTPKVSISAGPSWFDQTEVK